MVAVAAVLGDHQAPAQRVQCAVGTGVAKREAVGNQRLRERPRVVGGFGGVDQAVRLDPCLLAATRRTPARWSGLPWWLQGCRDRVRAGRGTTSTVRATPHVLVGSLGCRPPRQR